MEIKNVKCNFDYVTCDTVAKIYDCENKAIAEYFLHVCIIKFLLRGNFEHRALHVIT